MNLPSIKRGAIKAMPPFQIENAVVLQPFTGHNPDCGTYRDAGGLVHYHRSRCFVADGEGDVSGSPVRKSGPRTGNPDARRVGVLSYLWVYGLIVEFAVMTLLSTTIFALFS
jgi:hypothetical protein